MANIPDSLLNAVAQVESSGNPNAVNKDTGALGLFQFMPATAKALGIDPLDPAQAKEGARQYLGYLVDKFGTIPKALAAWNWGEGNLAKHGLDAAPPETQAFIPKVLNALGKFSPIASAQADEMPVVPKGFTAVSGNPFADSKPAQNAPKGFTAVDGNPFDPKAPKVDMTDVPEGATDIHAIGNKVLNYRDKSGMLNINIDGGSAQSTQPPQPGQQAQPTQIKTEPSYLDSLKYGFADAAHQKDLNPENGVIGGFLKGIGPALEFGGALAGGTVGGLAGIETGPGAIATSVAGAGLGGAAGHRLQHSIGDLLGVQSPEAVGQAATDTAKVGLEDATGQAGGMAVGNVVNKALAPFADRITPEVQKMMATAKAKGITIPPGDVTNSTLVKGMQSILRKAPFSAEDWARLDSNNQQKLVDWADEVLKQAGGSMSTNEAGQTVKQGAKDIMTNAEKSAYGMAQRIKQYAGGVKPDIAGKIAQDATRAGAQAFKQKMNDAYTELGNQAGSDAIPSANYKRAVQFLQSQKSKTGQFIDTGKLPVPSEVPDTIPDWATYQQIRSELTSMAKSGHLIGYAQAGQAKYLRNALDQDANTFLQSRGNDIWNQKLALDNAYREGKQLFNESVVGRVSKDTFAPERVVATVIKPRGITDIRNMKKAVGPDAWDMVSRAFVEDTVSKFTNETTGVVDVKGLQKFVKQYGEQTLREAMGPDRFKAFMKFVNNAAIRKGNLPDIIKSIAGKANEDAFATATGKGSVTQQLLDTFGLAQNKAATKTLQADAMRRALLTNMLEKAKVDGKGIAPDGLSGDKLQSLLNRMDPATRQLLFGNKVAGNTTTGDRLTDLAKIGSRVRDKMPDSGTATRMNLIGGLAGGAYTGAAVLQGDMEKAKSRAIDTAMLLAGPKLITKFLMSPTGSKWLTTGFKTTPLADALFQATGIRLGEAAHQ